MTDSRPTVAVFQMVHGPTGGVQRVLATVLPELRDEFRIVVIDPYNEPEFAAAMRARGLEVASLGPGPRRRYVGGRGSPWRVFYLLRSAPWMLLTMWRFWRWVRRQRPAAVYFNQLPAARVFGRLIAQRKVGLVYHLHGALSAEDIGPRTARLLSRRFARVLAVSKITARFLLQAGTDPDKVRVVYNAVDAAAIRRAAQEPSGPLPRKPAGSVAFVHVGVLTRHKKAQHLGIEALGHWDRPLARSCGSVETCRTAVISRTWMR